MKSVISVRRNRAWVGASAAWLATAALSGLALAAAPAPHLHGPAGGSSAPSALPPRDGGAAATYAAFPPMQEPQQVARNLYVIAGKGCNTLVWIHAQGVLLVDPKLPGAGADLLAMVAKLTSKPVTHVVLTHLHGDHAGSSGEFPAGTEFIAQENTARRMATLPQYADRRGLPTRTFKDRLDLFNGTDQVQLHWFGRAHTDGDAIVVIPSAGFMAVGDILKRKEFPSIDALNGGSGASFPATVDALYRQTSNIQWLLGGHADDVFTRSYLNDYRHLTRLLYEAELEAARSGQSAAALLAELKLPQRFASFAVGPRNPLSGEAAIQSAIDELRGPVFDSIRLGAKDIHAVVRFYVEGLGLREVDRRHKGELDEVFLNIGAGGSAPAGGMTPRLILMQQNTDPPEDSMSHLILRVADIRRAVVAARDAGGRVVLEPATIPGGMMAAELADPAGNHLQLIQAIR